MYTNITYDVHLPSECPKHSELNGGLIVRNGIQPTLYKRQSVCQSNISKLKDKYPNFEVGLKCILMVNPYLLVCSYIK